MSDSKPGALRKVAVPEPWPPAEATDRFRAMAADSGFDIIPKIHALDQMEERGIFMPEVLYVMKHGFVYGDPVAANQPGLYRYTVKGPSLHPGRRDIKVVIIPSMHKACAKIVTVMWADEIAARG